jgi:hypothetical protein
MWLHEERPNESHKASSSTHYQVVIQALKHSFFFKFTISCLWPNLMFWCYIFLNFYKSFSYIFYYTPLVTIPSCKYILINCECMFWWGIISIQVDKCYTCPLGITSGSWLKLGHGHRAKMWYTFYFTYDYICNNIYH